MCSLLTEILIDIISINSDFQEALQFYFFSENERDSIILCNSS